VLSKYNNAVVIAIAEKAAALLPSREQGRNLLKPACFSAFKSSGQARALSNYENRCQSLKY